MKNLEFLIILDILIISEIHSILSNMETRDNNTKFCFDNEGQDEFICNCNDGFVGKTCEIVCPKECGSNGKCKDVINDGILQFECNCDLHYQGTIIEKKIFFERLFR